MGQEEGTRPLQSSGEIILSSLLLSNFKQLLLGFLWESSEVSATLDSSAHKKPPARENRWFFSCEIIL
ncbi:MAG: hypothetical protein CMJ79_03725 [Planctomycetaceae bacterium]|nr:hypothetical protein [Planctomycetaceae bacterium]